MADLHFSHEAIRVHCGRPFRSTSEHDEKILANINSVVTRKDTSYIGGDFAWKDHGHWIHALNGKKILILGNHDKMAQEHLRCFSQVTQILELKIDKHRVIICHFPMVSWNASCHGTWHLYGHVHGRYRHPGLAMDIGVDTNGYMPYSWDDIRARMYAKVAENRLSGGYMAWKSVGQCRGIGVTLFRPESLVCVFQKGHDNRTAPWDAKILEDEGGKHIVCEGKHYLKDFALVSH